MLVYHLLCGKTSNSSLWHIVNGWFYMTYTLPFVKCDMFICVISNKDVQSLVDMLFTDEVSHWGL